MPNYRADDLKSSKFVLLSMQTKQTSQPTRPDRFNNKMKEKKNTIRTKKKSSRRRTRMPIADNKLFVDMNFVKHDSHISEKKQK